VKKRNYCDSHDAKIHAMTLKVVHASTSIIKFVRMNDTHNIAYFAQYLP